ncbi:MAG: hypothetical protein ACD_21C00286G0004 [uncultured bacterium]|nr:MAG: hypothetical protein ACD_21C00286G0004 [uncultured bacterium]
MIKLFGVTYKRQTKLVGILVSVLMFGYSGIGWAFNLSLEKVYSIKMEVNGTVSDHATEIKPALIGDDIRIGGGLTIIKYPSNGESRIAYKLPKVVGLKPRHVKIYAYDGPKKERLAAGDEKQIFPNTQNFNDFFEGVYPSGVVVSSFVEENIVIDVFSDRGGTTLIRRLSAVNPGLDFDVIDGADGVPILVIKNTRAEEIEITEVKEATEDNHVASVNMPENRSLAAGKELYVGVTLNQASYAEGTKSSQCTVRVEYKKAGNKMPPIKVEISCSDRKALLRALQQAQAKEEEKVRALPGWEEKISKVTAKLEDLMVVVNAEFSRHGFDFEEKCRTFRDELVDMSEEVDRAETMRDIAMLTALEPQSASASPKFERAAADEKTVISVRKLPPPASGTKESANLDADTDQSANLDADTDQSANLDADTDQSANLDADTDEGESDVATAAEPNSSQTAQKKDKKSFWGWAKKK